MIYVTIYVNTYVNGYVILAAPYSQSAPLSLGGAPPYPGGSLQQCAHAVSCTNMDTHDQPTPDTDPTDLGDVPAVSATIESRAQLVDTACTLLVAEHGQAHGTRSGALSYHGVEHVEAVLDHVEAIAEALALAEEGDDLCAARLAAAGHDRVLHSEPDAESGRLIRSQGATPERETDTNASTSGRYNQAESLDRVVAILESLDPERTYWDDAFVSLLREAIDATLATVALAPIDPEALRVQQPRTDATVDLSRYAYGSEHEPLALKIGQPHLTADTRLPAVVLALADLAYIGITDYDTFRREGNAEFREIEVRFRDEQLPDLSAMSSAQRADFVTRMFDWWRSQITLPLQQRRHFLDLLDTNATLLTRASAEREALFAMFSNYEGNALHAAEFYERMQEQYGELQNPDTHTVDSSASFHALLAEMGYGVPDTAASHGN